MIFRFHLGLLLLILTFNASAQIAPSVVVSIKPIHSIVSSLMQGVSVPQLLLKSHDSAHNFHIRPSQASALENADLIISISPNFESGLTSALSNYSPSSQIIIAELKLENLYSYRGVDDAQHDDHDDHDDHNQEYDYHLWLDINNAKLIAEQVAQRLIKLDTINESTYTSNLQVLNAKLLKLEKDINLKLASVGVINFANYSDTLQYFEKSHNLSHPIVITPFHGSRLSIRAVLNAKKLMRQQQTKCLLHTNQVSVKKTKILTEDMPIKREEISILGNELESGSSQYFKLMNNLTSQIAQCLR